MTIRQQAIQLCEFAANSGGSPTLDKLALNSEFTPESADLADEACNVVCLSSETIGYTWRELWAEAAQRLREGWTP